jgi:N-acetylated-alpha-linked acidic dipeptidase
MRSIGRLVAILLVLVFLGINLNLRPVISQSSSTPPANLDGFSTEGSTTERRWEEEFRRVPAPASAREHLRRLTAEPHVAGTKEDYATAVYVRDQIRSYGISSELK